MRQPGTGSPRRRGAFSPGTPNSPTPSTPGWPALRWSSSPRHRADLSTVLSMSGMSDVLGLAVDEMQSALTPALDRSWEVRAGDVEWTCRATASHVADDLFSYASQVIAQPER